MPLSLSREDRRLLIVAGSLFVICALLAIIFTPGASEARFATSYSAAAEGAKAAYLLLQESGYPVERWSRPPAELSDPDETILFLTDPTELPTQMDKDALEKFLTDGGVIVVSGDYASLFVPTPSRVRLPFAERFRALTPSAQALSAPEVEVDAVALRTAPVSGIALYGDSSRYAVVQSGHGSGSVIWLASSSLLSNAGLGQSQNLEFLLSTIGSKSRRVLWDEYFHGHRETKSRATAHPQLPWLFGQLAFVAAAVLLTFSRQSLPRRPSRTESRLSPLEYARALGQLYEHAHAANVAVDIYYEHFRYTLLKRMALRHSATDHELTQAVAQRWQIDSADLLALLNGCASARFFEDLKQKEALALVQRLHKYSVLLKFFPETAQEGR